MKSIHAALLGSSLVLGYCTTSVQLQAAEKSDGKYLEKALHMCTTAPFHKLEKTAFLIMKEPATNSAPAGTGFYVDYEERVWGVTARHVVQVRETNSWRWMEFRTNLFRRVKGEGTAASAKLGVSILGSSLPESIFFLHPNPKIDAVVFPILSYDGIDESVVVPLPFQYLQPDDSVNVGEDVYVLGFPGIYGFDRGTPVIRSGTIAYKIDQFNYLLDANLWQGDSGGLVASKPYFGVPVENKKSYQWHIGGKVLGLSEQVCESVSLWTSRRVGTI